MSNQDGDHPESMETGTTDTNTNADADTASQLPSPSPLAILQTNPAPDALPDGWIAHKSRSQPGFVYYFNQFTGENRWDLPFMDVKNLEGIKETIENLANLAKKEKEADQKEKILNHNHNMNNNGLESGGGKSQRSILKKSGGGEEMMATTTTKKRSRGSSDSNNHHTSSKKSRPEQVRVLHILKKHNKSRRPASWRQSKITISKEEAIDELKELMSILDESKGDPKELRATFEELAKTESDCSSAKRGGDVGFFGRKKMQPNFEAASFGLAIGEMSGIVETSSGVHVILRLG